MLQCNLGYTAEQAGWVFFVFPLGAAAITPILGNFLDHRGKGATMLIFGALLMIACHLVFALVLPALKGTTAAVTSPIYLSYYWESLFHWFQLLYGRPSPNL